MFRDSVETGFVRLVDVTKLVSGQRRPYVDRQLPDRTGGFLDDDPLAVELRGGLLMDHTVRLRQRAELPNAEPRPAD
jgi:hypothetical protein